VPLSSSRLYLRVLFPVEKPVLVIWLVLTTDVVSSIETSLSDPLVVVATMVNGQGGHWFCGQL